MVWDSLAEAVRKPLAGPAHRPAMLQVRPGACWERLRPHFDEMGIAVQVTENLAEFDAAFASLTEHRWLDPTPTRKCFTKSAEYRYVRRCRGSWN